MEEDQTWDHHFCDGIFQCNTICGIWKNNDSGETIRIGYIDYGGFIDLDENGEYTGYGVELLDKIAEYTGWKYEYVYDTWDNVLKNWSQVRLI